MWGPESDSALENTTFLEETALRKRRVINGDSTKYYAVITVHKMDVMR